MTEKDSDKDLVQEAESKRLELIEVAVSKFGEIPNANEELANKISEQLKKLKDDQGVYNPFICKYVPNLRNLVYITPFENCKEAHLQ